MAEMHTMHLLLEIFELHALSPKFRVLDLELHLLGLELICQAPHFELGDRPSRHWGWGRKGHRRQRRRGKWEEGWNQVKESKDVHRHL